MKSFVIATVLLLPLMFCTEVIAAENPTQGAWGESGSPAVAKADNAESGPMGLRKGLSRRERREVGATLLNALRITKEIKAEDSEGFKEYTPEELSAVITAQLIAEMPAEAFAGKVDRDWEAFFDAVLRFIEALLPIILKIIALF